MLFFRVAALDLYKKGLTVKFCLYVQECFDYRSFLPGEAPGTFFFNSGNIS